MKTTTQRLFKNNFDCYNWIEINCDLCAKQSKYNPNLSGSQKFKCAIDRDIQLQLHGLLEINVRSLFVVNVKYCRFIK